MRPGADAADPIVLDVELARRLLVAGIQRELRRFGFKRGVLGLSGGVDSSLAAFLTAEALGPENVLAVLMPYRTSSPDSVSDAQEVIERLGIASEKADITPMADPFFERFPDMDQRRRGNVMARLRMVTLYDRSEAFKGLVIGTSNKTELLLGYGTLFGDMASAVNPLGDLYKTQVRQLARHMGVPEHIILKAPSADLWPGQTDEGELGVTYEEVDRLLVRLIDQRWTRQELIGRGFEPRFVDRVWQMIQRSQYKRKQPTILKLGKVTVG